MSQTSSTGSAPAPKAVQSPLTLVMKIKSDAAYQELKALLNQMQSAPPDRNPIWVALNKLRNVHFARFVFLNNNTQLAVITTYDGAFEAYINEFIDAIGDIFNALLQRMDGAPPLPVQKTATGRLRTTKRVRCCFCRKPNRPKSPRSSPKARRGVCTGAG